MDPSWRKYLDPRTLAKLHSLPLRADRSSKATSPAATIARRKGFRSNLPSIVNTRPATTCATSTGKCLAARTSSI